MKKLFLSILFASFSPLFHAEAQTNATIHTIDGFAAQVNDQTITLSEVRELLRPFEAEVQRSSRNATEYAKNLNVIFQDILNDLIEQMLIEAEFEEAGGVLPEQYIISELNRIIDSSYGGNAARFEQMLTQKRKTRKEYMQDVRRSLIVTMMTNERVTSRVRITPKQIRESYEDYKEKKLIPTEIKFSAIILQAGDTPEEQQVKLSEAHNITEKLNNGADFSDLARSVSEGAHAADGGEFPATYIEKIESKELQDKLTELEVGKISEPILMENKLHIFKIQYRKTETFESARESIRQFLQNQEQQRLYDQWITNLKSKNHIRIFAK